MTRIVSAGFTFEVAGFSEQGPRSENQDAFRTDGFGETGLLAVADGMGGEKSGRVAADTALDAISMMAPLRTLDDARRAVREADRRIAEVGASNPGIHGGMGCALGLLSLSIARDGGGWIAAHVGDVRILSRSPDGLLRLETRDHTPAFSRWEAGEISIDEIADSSGANRLQRAVGRGGTADVAWLPIGAGWSWLLISDGVYKAMRLDELSAALDFGSIDDACGAIRRKVEERGPDDNFTAVLVRALNVPAARPGIAGGADRTPPSNSMPRQSTPANPRRSRAAAVTTGIALVALIVAVLAFWNSREGRLEAAQHSDFVQLRSQVDSLRSVVDELIDPFGPSAPAPVPGATIPLTPAGP